MSVDHIDPINMFNNITKELTLNNKEIEVLLRAFQGENAHHKGFSRFAAKNPI